MHFDAGEAVGLQVYRLAAPTQRASVMKLGKPPAGGTLSLRRRRRDCSRHRKLDHEAGCEWVFRHSD